MHSFTICNGIPAPESLPATPFPSSSLPSFAVPQPPISCNLLAVIHKDTKRSSYLTLWFVFPGILLFNPSLLQILFPTVAISKECSFLRTQPKISLILARCPGVLFHTETSGSSDQYYPLFHFWFFLSGADSSCSEPLTAPQMLLPRFSPPPFYTTTFPSSHRASFPLYCCDKTFQENTN